MAERSALNRRASSLPEIVKFRIPAGSNLLQNRFKAFNEIVTILLVIEDIALARFREQCYDAGHREDQFRIGVT
jgi:hypothetical protein